MPIRSLSPDASPIRDFRARRVLAALLALAVLLLTIAPALALPDVGEPMLADAEDLAGHLVISELSTGGAGASDEFVELYNPVVDALPLEGLELVYISASGATVTRKTSWALGAAEVPSGGHLLIANEAGIFAAIADVTYANGMAAAGGSVALRIIGASTAVDAVGWGTAASTWLEGRPTPAPDPGASLERLPGGASGSGQDTDDNLVDFALNALPDPQNSGSPATPPQPTPTSSPASTATPTPEVSASPAPTITPTAVPPTPSPSASANPTATPTIAPTSTPTVAPTVAPTAAPTPAAVTIDAARAAPDGSTVTIAGVAITDSTFADGGGYLTDATGGIAVLLSAGTFARGTALLVTGIVDDRYGQRTIRSSDTQITPLGPAAETPPTPALSGEISEALEGQLVTIHGVVASSATLLSAGVAFDVDDGSGPVRVLLNGSSGIDSDRWERGIEVRLVGVVGQRDAGGTGLAGYRVQPRDAADILTLAPAATASPSLTPSVSPSPSASPSPSISPAPTPSPSESAGPTAPLVTIAESRMADRGVQVRIRGIVTAGNRLIDPVSAVVQDSTAAIVVRLSNEAGVLRQGQVIEALGITSTKSGMLTLRVSDPPVQLGNAADPAPLRTSTGRLGETQEALLIVARGALTGNARRSSAGSVSFGIDDGTGEVRVFISSSAGIDVSGLATGAWVEVRGVLGQETTGAQPDRGYRIWPRAAGDLAVIAPAVSGGGAARNSPSGGRSSDGPGGSRGPRSATAASAAGAGAASSSRGHDAGGPTLRVPTLGASTDATPSGSRGPVGPHAAQALDAATSAITDTPPAAVDERSPLRGIGLLAVSAAALLAIGLLAWRSGAIDRLLRVFAADVRVPDAGAQAAAEIEAIPRLSVVGPPGERAGP